MHDNIFLLFLKFI